MFNPESAEKANDKIYVCKLKKNVVQAVMYQEFKDWRATNVDLDEAAHDELPHLALHCLQIQVFSFLTLKVFKIPPRKH